MRLSRSRRIVALVLGGLFLACAVHAADKADLGLRLEPGKTYGMELAIAQTVDQTVMGQKKTLQQEMGFGYSFAVEKSKGKNILVKVTYDWARTKQSGEKDFEYDSRKKGKVPAGAEGFAAMVGESFTLELDPKGKIVDLAGAEAIMDKILANSNVPEGPMKEMAIQQIKAQFGTDALKHRMEEMTAIFPTKPVAVGESWSKTVRVDKGFPMIIENAWTLEKREKGEATVSLDAKVKPNPDGEHMKLMGMTLQYTLAGTQTGSLVLDEASGWTKSATMTQNLSGKIDMGPQMQFPVTIKSTVNMTGTL